jgi:transcriptional regulator with XRE-family HTH domain
MPALERLRDRATAIAARHLVELGGEFRERRMSLGRSQALVAAACRLSRSRYAWIEAGKIPTVTLVELYRIATVLGLDLAVRLFPGGPAARDAGHTSKLAEFLSRVKPPLRSRIEVPLPATEDRWERRAWDAVIFGEEKRTAIELEITSATSRRSGVGMSSSAATTRPTASSCSSPIPGTTGG